MQDLRKLAVNKNQIALLEGIPHLPSLKHLVLSENQIADVKQLIHLNRNHIRQLDFAENPVVAEKGEGFKTELLIAVSETNTQLRKLNEDEITDEDYANARNEKAERIKAEEAARREAAERAAEKAAAGEAPVEEVAE